MIRTINYLGYQGFYNQMTGNFQIMKNNEIIVNKTGNFFDLILEIEKLHNSKKH